MRSLLVQCRGDDDEHNNNPLAAQPVEGLGLTTGFTCGQLLRRPLSLAILQTDIFYNKTSS